MTAHTSAGPSSASPNLYYSGNKTFDDRISLSKQVRLSQVDHDHQNTRLPPGRQAEPADPQTTRCIVLPYTIKWRRHSCKIVIFARLE